MVCGPRIQTRFEGILGEPVAEEEAAGLDGGTDEWRTNATVQAGGPISAQGLAQAVEWASVAQGLVRRLRLQTHFDSVEGVFDDFADYAGELVARVVSLGLGEGRSCEECSYATYRAERDVLDCLCFLTFA